MANYQIKLNKDIFIPLYYPYLNKFDKSVEIYFGSRNSGKSYFIAQKLLKIAMSEPYSVTLCVRELRNSLKGTVFKSFTNILRDWKLLPYCKVNNTELIITLPNKASIEFVGIDNVDAIKSKPIISRVFYEECDRLTKDAYETISGSMRGKGFTMGEFFAFNPPQSEFFLFDLYLNSINLDELYEKKIMETDLVRVFHSTWRDNPFQNQDRLEKKYANLKERDYWRWLRDSEGRMGTEQTDDCMFPVNLIMDSLSVDYFPKKSDSLVCGVDCARFGDDSTVISVRYGNKVLDPLQLRHQRTTTIAEKTYNHVVKIIQQYDYEGRVIVNIDGTGLGAGVVDNFVSMKKDKEKYPYMKQIKIVDINFSNKAVESELYHDIISESAFTLKELLLNREIQLPRHDSLLEELGARKRTYDNKNRDMLEQKKEFKKRLGKSPDFMDSLLLLFVNKKKKLIFLSN